MLILYMLRVPQFPSVLAGGVTEGEHAIFTPEFVPAPAKNFLISLPSDALGYAFA
jgi:hypothetical protein